MSGAEQIATSATTAMPPSVTAVKYAAWYAAMHAPIPRQRQRSPFAMAKGRAATAVASTRRIAASHSRATPTSRGLAAARSASTVITEPLVPHEIAASAMRTRPATVRGA